MFKGEGGMGGEGEIGREGSEPRGDRLRTTCRLLLEFAEVGDSRSGSCPTAPAEEIADVVLDMSLAILNSCV